MDPTFLNLSAEILIEILAYLPLRGIVACQLTCRKLHDIIADSSLLQYIIQTFLAGVHDPLIPGASTVERMSALKTLEATWRDLDIRRRTAHINQGTAWPWLNYTVHDDYLLAVRGDSDHPNQPPGYSYIDLRERAAYTDPQWKKVDVPWSDQHCMFAFAANENDLAVVVTYARHEDISRAEAHFLSFVDGLPHPSAQNPDLVVNFPGPSSPHHIQVQITGDHIFLSCNGLPHDEHQVDVLFLISWKEGKVTSLRDTPLPAMTFAVGFTWISETLLAFIHMAENAIHLYEFADEPGQVKLIRVLELPPLCDGGRLNFAQCNSEQNPVFHSRGPPSPSYPSSGDTRPPRPPPRFPFRYNPADGIACFILGVGLEEIPGASMTIAIVVHRHVLVALASAASAASASANVGVSSSSSSSAGTIIEQQRVPWDSWGPSATRCLEVPYWRRSGEPIGQRWAMLAHDELVVRDFNPHNVRQAAAQLSPTPTSQGQASNSSNSSSNASSASGTPVSRNVRVLRHENGNRTRVITAPTLLTAGLCFRGDVISHLPYVETRAKCAPRWESVLTDGERLFGLYFKEDDADAHKVDIDIYFMGPPAQ